MAFPHSEFEELCALALTGELTEEDWRRLGEHLQYCPLCCDTLKDHTEIAAIAAAHYSTAHDPLVASDFDVDAGERRLMRELKRRPNGGSDRKLMSFIVIGLSSALTLFASWLALHEHHQHLADSALLAETRSRLHINPPALPPAPAAPLHSVAVNQAIEAPKLREDLRQALVTQEELRAALSTATQQIDASHRQNDALETKASQLGQQLAAVQNETDTLRQRVAAAESVARLNADQQNELKSLRASLAERDRLLAENETLLSHDRDIRDLIGARNLVIEDVYDVGTDGKRNKPVGRIFYTKDKSLVFYGYDLDQQRGLKQSVAFQAWGAQENGGHVSLGLFYHDNEHKRWVLKFNDPATLARLKSIFVTIEPSGGSEKPTGQRLLVASLRIDPNFP